MGQTQSTDSQRGSEIHGEQVEGKTDYYELIGVERDASPEEIKKAYRKKALELHPDRNYGNAESATKLFAEIQSAYEVLSDPQERAWYDSHRDAFLEGDGMSSGAQYSYDTRMTTAADIMKLFSRFSPRMEFSDSPKGFYGGLRETFEQLALEEKVACQWENAEYVDYPSFGTSSDDFENIVRPFYAAWSGFSTRKSFAWKDAYRYSEAPDRRVRRLMEKENKRLREEGIREFNDAVRSLVAFVKKRDPRYKVNTQSEAQRQEILRQSAAAQAARSRAVNKAKLRDHITPDWAKSDYLEEDVTDSSESELEHFECVVCHKSFKSQKQFEAHERSKKHIKAVKQLCWEMTAQDKELNLGADVDINTANKVSDLPSTGQKVDQGPIAVSRHSSEAGSLSSDIESHGGDTTYSTASCRHHDARAALDSDGHDTLSQSDQTGTLFTQFEDRGADYASREVVEGRIQAEYQTETVEDPIDTLSQRLTASDPMESTTLPNKLGKAKLKRAKRAAKGASEQPTRLTCATCKASFSSRTQLFSHIRELGHARPPTTPTGFGGKKPKKQG